MHIVGLLLAALAGVGVLLWRLNAAADAANELADKAGDVRGFFRRRKWQQKLLSDPLSSVEDPRLAAAAMMVALAQNDGALTEREQGLICEEIAERFDCKPPQNEDMLAQARWIVSDQRDIDTTLRKMMAIVRNKCGPTEIKDVFEMLESVAGANGRVGDTERRAIDTLKRMTKV
jgi:uncharacterized tellurite resistance protein B-like protein